MKTSIIYEPTHMYAGTTRQASSTEDAYLEDYYKKYDALYHFFVTDPEEDACGCDDEDGEAPEGSFTHEQAVIRLLSGRFDSDKHEPKLAAAFPNVEPSWQHIRDTASFIAGELVNPYMTYIKNNLRYHISWDTVHLDAEDFLIKTKDHKGSGFNAFMDLAENTKRIVEDRLAIEYAHSTRQAIGFLNADATDLIDPPGDCMYEEGRVPSKWMVEARYLANTLIDIKEFRKNFNTLVIYNAHRFILSGDLNVTKIYRLLAKLGRVNTKVIFVG